MAGQYLNVSQALFHARTHDGVSLGELSRAAPLLLAFVHQFDGLAGRETLAEVSLIRSELEAQGARVAVVHTRSEHDAAMRLRELGMQTLVQVSDPAGWLFRALCLRAGGAFELLGSQGWTQGLGSIRGRSHASAPQEAPVTMPRIFLVYKEEILREYRPKHAADRTDPLWMAPRPHRHSS
jgi:hypothetical protein